MSTRRLALGLAIDHPRSFVDIQGACDRTATTGTDGTACIWGDAGVMNTVKVGPAELRIVGPDFGIGPRDLLDVRATATW